MPVPFIERLLLRRPNVSSSPQTMAQIIGSVVVTRKMPRCGSVGSASNTSSPACTSANGRTSTVSSLPAALAGWSLAQATDSGTDATAASDSHTALRIGDAATSTDATHERRSRPGRPAHHPAIWAAHSGLCDAAAAQIGIRLTGGRRRPPGVVGNEHAVIPRAGPRRCRRARRPLRRAASARNPAADGQRLGHRQRQGPRSSRVPGVGDHQLRVRQLARAPRRRRHRATRRSPTAPSSPRQRRCP